MRYILVFIVLLLVLGCTKHDLVDENLLFKNTDKNYPTTFKKLTKSEIKNRQKEFENGQFTFSLIDSFGFVGWSNKDDYELRKQLHSTQFSDVSTLTSKMKIYLYEKEKFTGVTEISQLNANKIKPRFLDFGGTYNCSDSTLNNSLYLDFGSQYFEGFEVINSLLTVFVTANGVYHVFGHWFPEVYIPSEDQVSVELAKSVLTGRKLTGYNGWGQKLNHFVVVEDLFENRKVIYPFINDDRLELRVCWEFKPSHWQIFMDTTTGEILVEQDVAFYLH